jgi:hypothetical protein
MKPTGKSQGKGIFLFHKLSQIAKWKSDNRWRPDKEDAECYVVQRYIQNPYLLGGRKVSLICVYAAQVIRRSRIVSLMSSSFLFICTLL